MKYNNYIRYLSDRVKRRLEDIDGVYGFEYGSEFEIALCEVLRDFLPIKYGICRGFVVDSEGNKAGDDIIIYDQELFPTLKLRGINQYARKEMIPIEAVYAYIEAKHTMHLDENNITNNGVVKALEQVRAVKALCAKRKQVPLSQIEDIELHLDNYEIIPTEGWPSYRNPLFTAIIARNIKINNKQETNADTIEDKMFKQKWYTENEFNPELILLGENNFFGSCYYTYNLKLNHYKNGVTNMTESLFRIDNENNGAPAYKVDKLGYGLFFAYLMAALDYIKLGRMPWGEIITELTFTEF